MAEETRGKGESAGTDGGRQVAIFDIDGTIFRSSLLVELVKALVHDGLIGEETTEIYMPAYRRWLDRKGPYSEYISAVVRAFDASLPGISGDDLTAVANQVIPGYRYRVYRFTSDLVSQLKRDGYFMLAISHSPKCVLDAFCSEWGFDKVYGRIYEVGEDGFHTGNTEFLELINDKEKILQRAVARNGLTMAGSVGVGDTDSDISFLKTVERPICFNPNELLYRHAKEKGWEVVVERKDVIYRI